MNPTPKSKENFIKRTVDKFFVRMETSHLSDRWLLRFLFFVVILSGVFALYTYNQDQVQTTPVQGGTLREGIIGSPRFVNPVLAITRADQDITSLVYSGLMRIDENGQLVPDLAEEVVVSDDGLTYNVTIKRNVNFHDGTPLTARDVVYTIGLIQDSELKSPLQGNWANVTIEQINEYELNIILDEPYAPFKENFLVGILPAHLWSDLPVEQIPFSQLNTEPVGSGPFKIERSVRDVSGIINEYHLKAFREGNETANIDELILKFYGNEDSLIKAFEQDLIDASAYVSNENISRVMGIGEYKLLTSPLPRTFAIFLNQNRSAVLRETAVREALSVAVNRSGLVESVLSGYGVPTEEAIPSSTSTLQSEKVSDLTRSERLETASEILSGAGWLPNNQGLLEKQVDGSTETLSITIRTSNSPLLDKAAEAVANDWKALGVEVSTEQFEQTDLVQSVIRPRDFEALLFGVDMSRSLDLYPFWHSSQKDDPGLNVAGYANLSVDEFLEKARQATTSEARNAAQQSANKIITEELPAIFLFQPQLTYLIKEDIIVDSLTNNARPSDRFSNITEWHTQTDDLWKIFRKE